MSSNALMPAHQSSSERHGPLLRLRIRLRLLNYFKAAPLLNFNRIVKRALLIIGVQQFEDIFSTAGTNLRSWLNVVGLGPKDVRTERRTSEDDCILFVQSIIML